MGKLQNVYKKYTKRNMCQLNGRYFKFIYLTRIIIMCPANLWNYIMQQRTGFKVNLIHYFGQFHLIKFGNVEQIKACVGIVVNIYCVEITMLPTTLLSEVWRGFKFGRKHCAPRENMKIEMRIKQNKRFSGGHKLG